MTIGPLTCKDGNIDFSLLGGAESLAPNEATASTSGPTLSHPRRTVVPDGSEHPKYVERATTDFLWLMTEEPHRSRRKAIMKAHPEVTSLMGHTRITKYVVVLVVAIQLATAYYLRNSDPLSLQFLLLAYAIGGTANHNLFLAIHEISHNLAFKSLWNNRFLAMLANLPIGIPYAASFKQYHLEHHKNLGDDNLDADLPTELELTLFNSVLGKCIFCTFQILFYALRPPLHHAQPFTFIHLTNIASQLIFDGLLLKYLGYRAMLYLLMSSFFAGSLHPLAGHFIAEHYLWDGLEQETYSYYGILNILAYNVGYHNEHHDFPSIPWTRLPALRKLAPEFYDSLPSHPSWPMVIWNFIRDDNVGIFARAKRLSKRD